MGDGSRRRRRPGPQVRLERRIPPRRDLLLAALGRVDPERGRLSATPSVPVYMSTTTTGDCDVERREATPGMAAFRASMPGRGNEVGGIFASRITAFGFSARSRAMIPSEVPDALGRRDGVEHVVRAEHHEGHVELVLREPGRELPLPGVVGDAVEDPAGHVPAVPLVVLVEVVREVRRGPGADEVDVAPLELAARASTGRSGGSPPPRVWVDPLVMESPRGRIRIVASAVPADEQEKEDEQGGASHGVDPVR